LVGGAEDFLGALFGYHFRIRTTSTAEPMLYIAASIIGSLKAQRFATKQRHGFGFYLTQTAWRGFSVREISLGCVQQNVSAFVEKCLLRELRKRIDSELSTTRKALNISVRVIGWNALNT
jgi:hypothetical protein